MTIGNVPLVAVVVVALRRRTRSDTISDVKPLSFLVQWRQKRPPMAWGLHPQVISTPLLRAQLMNLVAWVEDGVEPPPSVHPRLSDGTAQDRADVLRSFPVVNGFRTPAPERLWMTREIDLGPQQDIGVGSYPPPEGDVIHCAVSALDADGNEKLSPDELVPVVSELAQGQPWDIDDKHCIEFAEIFDADKNGFCL